MALFAGLIYLAQKNGGVAGPTLEKLTEEEMIAEYTFTKGSENAKVILVEFTDFQCPSCRQIYPYVNEIAAQYPNEVLIAYRHFPLPQHPDARQAAIAAQAAGQFGKFWEYGEILFNNQEELDRESLVKYAEDLGIDRVQFEQKIDDSVIQKQVSDDIALGTRINVSGTPTFILNNSVLQYRSIEDFRTQIRDVVIREYPELAKPQENPLQNGDDSTESTTESTTSVGSPDYSQIAFDQKYGIIEIEYTDTGFIPSNVKAVQNQLVRWTNKTDKDIELEQLIKLYSDFEQPIIIAPNGTFELRMTQEKLWNFKEKSKRHYGSIYVVQP